jgi:Zn-finger nucleic acid-binding protein
MAMKCPKCKNVGLKPTIVKNTDVELDYCPDCKGLWLDGGEFEQISQYAMRDLSIPEDAKQKPLICPRCDVPMFQFYYPQTSIIIEMCRQCEGLWCDSGELIEIETVRKHLKEYGLLRECDHTASALGVLKSRFMELVGSAVSCILDEDE